MSCAPPHFCAALLASLGCAAACGLGGTVGTGGTGGGAWGGAGGLGAQGGAGNQGAGAAGNAGGLGGKPSGGGGGLGGGGAGGVACPGEPWPASIPADWVWAPDWDCDCPVFYAPNPEVQVPPIEWEPCPVLPWPGDCEQTGVFERGTLWAAIGVDVEERREPVDDAC